MEDFSDRYKKLTARGRRQQEFSDKYLDELKKKIDRYFEKHPPKGKLGNPANFDDLAGEVNYFHKKNVLNNGQAAKGEITEEIIKGKYICELYNDLNKSTTKSILKVETLNSFLDYVLAGGHDSEIILLEDWKGSKNEAAPQWADYTAIPLKHGMLKSVSCDIETRSPYYRFGIKMLHNDGKLFGDGSIQSQTGPNLLIHTGKNFNSDELFISIYHNGVRKERDKYLDIIPENNCYSCKLFIDDEDFLHFYVNEEKAYKVLLIKEVRFKAYMMVWGDHQDPDPEVYVKNRQIEIKHA